MKFIAEYRYPNFIKPTYWRVIFADNVNDATKRADRYTKKGFICVKVISQ